MEYIYCYPEDVRKTISLDIAIKTIEKEPILDKYKAKSEDKDA